MTGVKIMEPGCNYVVGDVLNVTGTATTTGFTTGTVTVSAINNNIDDSLSVMGVAGVDYKQFNTLYRISGVTTTQQISVQVTEPISGGSTTGIGSTATLRASQVLTGKSLVVSDVTFNNEVGLATITTTQAHGFVVNNAATIVGSTSALYNGTFIVKENVGLTTFVVDVGITTLSPAIAGNMRVFHPGS